MKIPKATRNMTHANTSVIEGSIHSGGSSAQNQIKNKKDCCSYFKFRIL